MPRSSAQSGFSLLEVLISVGLLAILSLAVYTATSSSFDLNRKLSGVSLDATTIMLSLQVVQSDLEHIYSPNLGNSQAKPEDSAQLFWGPPVRSDGFRRTRLTGTPDKLTFVANNNRRVEADTTQSDLQKITWQVERNASNSFSLYRTTDWDAFRYQEDNSKKLERVALLENLSSAKFQFYRRDTKAWQDQWDSEGSLVKEEQRYPDLIKLRIEAPDPNNNANQLAWEIVVRPNVPLNYLDQKARNALKQRFE